MLDVMNRYAHGFVAVPVVLACRKGGVIERLQSGPQRAEALADSFGANLGHLLVSLRLFESLGWIDRNAEGQFVARTQLADHQQAIPDRVRALLEFDFEAYLGGDESLRLAAWIDEVDDRWGHSPGLIADFLDSLIVVPLLVILARRGLLDARFHAERFEALPIGVRTEIERLFAALGWTAAEPSARLTPIGEFMFARAMNLGVVESYRPMLQALDRLLFADARSVLAQDSTGRELHVDRSTNVVSSGFQHDRYFAEVEAAVISIFSRDPLSAQPRYVADMGCGDGAFLKRVYETVRDRTPRGQQLEEYPLTLIGIDLSKASLVETRRTLAGIDHIVLPGDIGDPARVVRDLEALGVDAGGVLHIRSFLDHDRPYRAPENAQALAARLHARYHGVYVDDDGGAIAPAEAVQNLVEHLERWAAVVNDHGLILLEVHCLDPLVVREHLDQSESLYFDAIQGFSKQLLVEADVALMAAAEAGLFPHRDFFRKFPEVLPYCRITLNLFERRPYRVRMARRDDVAALLRLEEACWDEGLRVPADELQRRIGENPLGQYVLELNGEIVGVVYTQRISDVDSLRACRFTEMSALHNETGEVIQLVTINVLPEKQHLGLGHELLDLMLLRSRLLGGIRRVAGITRCKDFRGDSLAGLAAYVNETDAEGRPVDPILRFHHSHGARFHGLVEGYRPDDVDNLGAGVLLVYEFGASLSSPEFEQIDRSGEARSGAGLEAALRRILGPKRESAFAWGKPLRDMALDSLDLLEFRTLLARMFTRPFPPTFFFSHPTLADIRRYLEADGDAPASEPAAPRVRLEQPCAVRAQGAPEVHAPHAIAIVGMAVRFPGAANLDEYASLLENGGDAIREFPSERWNAHEFLGSERDGPDEMVAHHGGFLAEVDEFDAAFFSISPREAELMDPQHRLLMELHWEALEHAAIDPVSLFEKACGIFVGLYTHDYETLQTLAGAEEDLGVYSATGTAASIAAGRLAYFLGTRGPAITLDTACSSSLVAVHEAMRSLLAQECDVALASGANLILSPRLSIAFSRAGMLSPGGRCRTFDAAADGYVRGEGCGVVVLKRLADALADGDRVLAVLRGSAVNQDGTSNGLTAPSLPAQEALLRTALADARLAPAEIDYVEAHGTGTRLGDPVEFQAIKNVFGADASRRGPLWLGSVKTNIGHTEAAAGMAGLVKVVLSMQRHTLPPHLHFEAPNPLIDLDSLPARIPVERTPWRSETGLLRAGVSSFGFSGTNAHVVVEEYPAPVQGAVPPGAPYAQQVLPISAKSAPALGALIERYTEWLERHPDVALEDICHTAAVGRAHHDHRIALRATTREALATELSKARARAAVSRRISDPPKVAFLFTGQGSQYPGMARELALEEPAFRAALRECSDILASELDVPLEQLLFAESDASHALDETANTQPALFAVEYALARMLEAWGIAPSFLIGHSVGEYVAACMAETFSLEDALRLIAARGRLMSALPRLGGMLAVLGPAEIVVRELERRGSDVSVAAFNGPENVVLSGLRERLEALGAELESAGLKTVPLQVSHAFHSPLMEPMLGEFAEEARRIRYSAPRIPVVSNVTGRIATEEMATPEYWVRHVREPVRFEQGIRTLADNGARIMLEVGPHPVLTGMGKACLRNPPSQIDWLATLSRGAPPWEGLTESLAVLYESGAGVDFRAVRASRPGRAITLPSYPWQRERYWFGTARAVAARPRPRSGVWDLAIEPAAEGGSYCWESEMTSSHPTGVADHRVGDVVAMPGAGMLVLALAAAREAFGPGPHSIEQFELLDVLALSESPRRVQLVLTPTLPGTLSLSIASRSPDDEWTLHARGCMLLGDPGDAVVPGHNLDRDTGSGARRHTERLLPAERFYEQMAARGLEYGPRFRAVKSHRQDGAHVEACLARAENLSWGPPETSLPVDIADSCLQALIGLAPSVGTAWVPVGIERFVVHDSPGSEESRLASDRLDAAGDYIVQGSRVAEDGATFKADARLLDSTGRKLAVFEGVRFKQLDGRNGRAVDDWFHEIDWVPVARAAEESASLDGFPSPASLTAQLQRVHASTAARDIGTAPLIATLDALCGAFAAVALARLGLPWRRGERLEASTLAQRLGVVARHERLLRRLLGMLEQDGLLARDAGDWLVIDVPADAHPTASLQALRERFPACDIELSLLERCAESLDEVLVGRCDPLQLLFPEGSLDHAGRLYQDSAFSRTCNAMIREAVQTAAAALAPGRTLRVLEIGAGTGGTTAHLLPLLDPERTRYVFTDVSPLFTARACEKFRDYPFVEYTLLDIAAPAREQGFSHGEFDLVVAANVLHATPDLAAALREARELLAPGGKLMLVEGVGPARWIDLIFGLTEGWWAFQDGALRPDHPLVPADGWYRLLQEVGYEAPVVVSNANDGTPALFEQAVIVASRPAAEQRREESTWVLFEDAAGTGERLRAQLLERGVRVLTVAVSDDRPAGADGVHVIRPEVMEDYTALLADIERRVSGAIHGVVYLWALDITAATDPAEAQILTCDAPANLVRALAGIERTPPRLWLVTRGAQPAAQAQVSAPLAAQLWGIGRVIALEHPELRCALIDLESSSEGVSADDDGPDAAAELAAELFSGGRATQVSLRRTGRHEARLVQTGPLGRAPATAPLALPRARAYQLSVGAPGTLDALEYRAVARRRPASGEVEIRVHASGVNFRDVLLVLGMMPDEPVRLGYDVCGEITAVGDGVRDFAVGNEVIALAVDTHAAFVRVPAELVARRPARCSAEEAAGVPVAFVTAAHALETLARVERGQSVLIHAATGGVGMAAVQIARLNGCEIFATAGSPAKRQLLRAMGVQHVFDSRSLDFASGVLRATGGRGVDVVLNSLTGDFIAKSFEVLAARGCFVEIGKRGIWTAEQAHAARPGTRYEFFDINQLGRCDPALVGGTLRRIVGRLDDGELEPLPVKVFETAAAREAFRVMLEARHIGKVVISHVPVQAGQRQSNASLGTCLITGAYGGLGLLLAKWLADRGRRHLALLGRRAPDADAVAQIEALERAGVQVLSVECDVSSEAELRRVFDEIARTMPPLTEVYHCAGALDDGALLELSAPRFATTRRPKVDGALHLDRFTRDLPLQRFVLFSSYSSMFGSPGQANHAAANAYLDALAHARRAQGLPAQSINWGPWAEIGAAAAYASRFASRGIGSFSPTEGLEALDRILEADRPQTAVVPFDVAKWSAASPGVSSTPLLACISSVPSASVEGQTPSSEPEGSAIDVRHAIAVAAGASQRTRIMEGWLREQAAAVLRAQPERVDETVPLKSLGFDSLLSVEFRNRLERQLGLQLPATLIWNHPTIRLIAENLLERLAEESAEEGSVADVEPEPEGLAPVFDDASLALLSEEDAAEQLERRLQELEGRF